jgi:hypothetical protein
MRPAQRKTKGLLTSAQRNTKGLPTGSVTIQKYPEFDECIEKPGLIFSQEMAMVLGDVLEPTPSLQEAPNGPTTATHKRNIQRPRNDDLRATHK